MRTNQPFSALIGLILFIALIGKANAETYTAIGAEQAASSDGVIPAFDNTPLTPPAEWSPGEHYVDPFQDDKPVAEVSAQNLSEHKPYLSAGQQTLLQQRPERQLRIFPTRRTAIYPPSIIEATQQNRNQVSMVDGGSGLSGYVQGFPFPSLNTEMPQDAALQALWNHLTRYRGLSFERTIMHTTVLENGDFVPVRLNQRYQRALLSKDDVSENLLFYHLDRILAPPKLAGTTLLVHEPLDHQKTERLSWIYSRSERRVRRLPGATHESPVPGTYNIKTADAHDLFNGAPDRYNWHYVGKQELYVPYNAYTLASAEKTYEDLLLAGTVNPGAMRWEKHRVHKIIATLKPDASHMFAKRVFYLDEDSWTILLTDSFNQQGELLSTAEGHLINFYDQSLPFYVMEAIYDLQSQRYVIFGLNNEEARGYDFSKSFSRGNFTPSALRRGAKG